jgi:ADP-ribose pyrophosphatase YjhB (NUDIX family)
MLNGPRRKSARRACYKLPMAREFSAGAVVVRRLKGRWWLAAIRPGGKPEGVWALPKGQIAPGESAADTALREVAEETGVEGTLEGKLGDVRYVYTWKGERVFKVVSFFLVRYRGGRIDDLPSKYRHEVTEARWIPLDEVSDYLTYKSEREMADRAKAAL